MLCCVTAYLHTSQAPMTTISSITTTIHRELLPANHTPADKQNLCSAVQYLRNFVTQNNLILDPADVFNMGFDEEMVPAAPTLQDLAKTLNEQTPDPNMQRAVLTLYQQRLDKTNAQKRLR